MVMAARTVAMEKYTDDVILCILSIGGACFAGSQPVQPPHRLPAVLVGGAGGVAKRGGAQISGR